MMGLSKRWLKSIFYRTGNATLLDRIMFFRAQLIYGAKNKNYINGHPDVALPSAYFLYETYMLSYQKYMDEGLEAAREIVTWSTPYLPAESKKVLEWGCGVSRIVRHLPVILPSYEVFGCDINLEMISWNRDHIHGVQFNMSGYHPPTDYPSENFGLVYAISVLTHIEGSEQLLWLMEIHRILTSDGIFLFTTHGEHYTQQLFRSEKKHLAANGYFTRNYRVKGHRMMTTYNASSIFMNMLSPYFTVLEFHEGHKDISKTGGQDLWIVRKI